MGPDELGFLFDIFEDPCRLNFSFDIDDDPCGLRSLFVTMGLQINISELRAKLLAAKSIRTTLWLFYII